MHRAEDLSQYRRTNPRAHVPLAGVRLTVTWAGIGSACRTIWPQTELSTIYDYEVGAENAIGVKFSWKLGKLDLAKNVCCW